MSQFPLYLINYTNLINLYQHTPKITKMHSNKLVMLQNKFKCLYLPKMTCFFIYPSSHKHHHLLHRHQNWYQKVEKNLRNNFSKGVSHFSSLFLFSFPFSFLFSSPPRLSLLFSGFTRIPADLMVNK